MKKSELQRSILIILLNQPENILISSPIVDAIKKNYPNSEIFYLTLKPFKNIALSIPAVDKVISYDTSNTQNVLACVRTHITNLSQARAILKQTKFDLCIDLENTLLSGILAWASAARYRVGLSSKGTNSLFLTQVISRQNGTTKQIGADYRYLVDQLGITYKRWKMHVPYQSVIGTESLNHIPRDSAYAVLCIGADKPEKAWKSSHWQQIALRIRGRYHLRCIIIDLEENREKCEPIAKACGATNVAGLVNFEEAGYLLRNANLVIGTDNYFTHAAVALKTPTLALFGPTCPYTFTDRESCKVIYRYENCSPCDQKPICKGKYTCMAEISPDIVLTETKPLLKSQRVTISKTTGFEAA